MALEDLTPAVRVEAILDGADIDPANRLEYFLKQAANEVPKPATSDAYHKISVSASGEYELTPVLFARGSGTDSIVAIDTETTGDDPCTATGLKAFSGGVISEAAGKASFAYGARTSGTSTQAVGDTSAAFGAGCVAEGISSFAAGQKSYAKANLSTAFGNNTIASGRAQTALGQYNVEDTEEVSGHGTGAHKYLLIVGNGTNANSKSNALTLDWDGNVVCRNIPAPPSAAGTYSLKCTVDASGNASYAWTL